MTDSEIAVNEKSADEKIAVNSHTDTRTGLLTDLQSLWNEVRILGYSHLQLAALEAQLAGKSLVIMIIAGLMIGILLSFVWIGLIAAIVLALAEYGVVENSVIQVLLSVALNLLAVMILWGIIRGKSRYLRFPATLHSLEIMRSDHHNPEEK